MLEMKDYILSLMQEGNENGTTFFAGNMMVVIVDIHPGTDNPVEIRPIAMMTPFGWRYLIS